MKLDQRARYADRIDRVVDHLATKLQDGEVPSLADLASVACLSEYHFHRIFRLMTGETVGDVIKRLRLERATTELANDNVTSAAAAGGYATPQAFVRAFKQQTGQRPSDAKASDTFWPIKKGEGSNATPAPMTIKVITREPFQVLALRNVGAYAELNSCYSELFDKVFESVDPAELLGIYGVPYDDPLSVPASQCRCDCAIEVGASVEARDPLKELTLGGEQFAVTRHLGDYDTMPQTIDQLYAAVIADEALEIGDAPAFVHYLDDPEEVAEADLRADIYLPVQGAGA